MSISQEIVLAPEWWRTWRDEAEHVLAELLQIRAAYIVLESELPGQDAGACWGCTWRGLARHLQREIGTRWNGDGPGMIVADHKLVESVSGLFVEDLPACLAATAWGVAAHETSHWLEFLAVNEFDDGTADFLAGIDVDRRASERLRLNSWRLANWSGPDQEETAIGHAVLKSAIADLNARTIHEPVIEHGPCFCWICLHVLHRLGTIGIDASLNSAIGYEEFGLPIPAYVMQSAIRAELAASETMPLADVSMMELPLQFLELFECIDQGE